MFLSLKIVNILANSEDPDEMPQFAAFHLGLQCLPKYQITGFQAGLTFPTIPTLVFRMKWVNRTE